jgi:hypothetical protein
LKEPLDEFTERLNALPVEKQEAALSAWLDAYQGDDKELIEPDLWEMIAANGAFNENLYRAS